MTTEEVSPKTTEELPPTDVLYQRAPSGDSKKKPTPGVTDRKLLKEIDDTIQKNAQLLGEVVLTYLNKQRQSHGMSQYGCVRVTTFCPFWEANSWWIHTNFQVTPIDDPAAKPQLFFAEVKNHVMDSKTSQVTKMCVLHPTDIGLNGCEACFHTHTRHPKAGGFRVGQLMYTIKIGVPTKKVKWSKEEQQEWESRTERTGRLRKESQCKAKKELKAKKKLEAKEHLKALSQSVAGRTRSRTSELSMAARTRSRQRKLSIGSTLNN